MNQLNAAKSRKLRSDKTAKTTKSVYDEKKDQEMMDELLRDQSSTPSLSPEHQSETELFASYASTKMDPEAFRSSLQQMMDETETTAANEQSSPTNVSDVSDSKITPVHSSRVHKVTPSPRVDRFVINNQDTCMEFLIPPKTKEDPIVIRQQIRKTLGDEFPSARSLESEQSVPGTQSANEATTMAYDSDKASRSESLLVLIIFSVLVSVFCLYYWDTIVECGQFATEWMMRTGSQLFDQASVMMESVKQKAQSLGDSGSGEVADDSTVTKPDL
jgi:hypothetical protein